MKSISKRFAPTEQAHTKKLLAAVPVLKMDHWE